MSEWRDIETAPKDGAWVFVYWPSMSITLYPLVAFWNGDDWDTTRDRIGLLEPTYWMPLPEPPDAQLGRLSDDGAAAK